MNGADVDCGARKVMARRVSIGFGLLLLASCGSGLATNPKQTPEPTVEATCPVGPQDAASATDADAGGVVLVPQGLALVVSLPANASTGYSWSYNVVPDDVVTDLMSEYVADQPVLPGSGGRQCIRFRAIRPGRAHAAFEYRRPWETGVPDGRVVEFDIAVQ
jgi:predicted secreted protein